MDKIEALRKEVSDLENEFERLQAEYDIAQKEAQVAMSAALNLSNVKNSVAKQISAKYNELHEAEATAKQG